MRKRLRILMVVGRGRRKLGKRLRLSWRMILERKRSKRGRLRFKGFCK